MEKRKGGEMEQGKGEKRRNGRKRKMADRRGAVASLFLFLSNKLLSICRPDPPPRAQKATQTRVRALRFSLTHSNPVLQTLTPTKHTHFVGHTYTLPTLFWLNAHTLLILTHAHRHTRAHTESNYSSQEEKEHQGHGHFIGQWKV